MTVRTSDAGQRTAQLARMLGGRAQFAEMFGGPLLPALKKMGHLGNDIDKAFPDGDGVALRDGGVLSFPGICSRAECDDTKDVRARVDAALRGGVLRRGLVLRCQTCQTRQLQTIDALGQRWNCERCNDTNDLDHTTWHHSTDEPTWFYGLHPVAQQLLADHGDVPALLARHLANTPSRRPVQYQDVMEIELLDGTSPKVETDLVAYETTHSSSPNAKAQQASAERRERRKAPKSTRNARSRPGYKQTSSCSQLPPTSGNQASQTSSKATSRPTTAGQNTAPLSYTS